MQTVIHNVQKKPFISQVDKFKYNELLLDLKNFFRYMKQDFNRLECIDIFGQTDGHSGKERTSDSDGGCKENGRELPQ